MAAAIETTPLSKQTDVGFHFFPVSPSSIFQFDEVLKMLFRFRIHVVSVFFPETSLLAFQSYHFFTGSEVIFFIYIFLLQIKENHR